MNGNKPSALGMTRRQLLAASGAGFGLLALADLLAQGGEVARWRGGEKKDPHHPTTPPPHHPPRAKRCIFLCMPGGPSQLDTFDPKPRLLAESGKPLPFEKPKLERTKTGNLFGSPWKFR